MFRRKSAKVKVRIYKCVFGYCADFYLDDAKKVFKTIEKCKKKILKTLPFLKDVEVRMRVFGYPIYEADLKDGLVGFTDSEELNRIGLSIKNLNDFISAIKSILERRKMEYEVVVE